MTHVNMVQKLLGPETADLMPSFFMSNLSSIVSTVKNQCPELGMHMSRKIDLLHSPYVMGK